MPLEFALRPRIRLSEDAPAPRRAPRLRLPKLALPIVAYWLTAGGITYALIRAHDQPSSVAETAPALAPTVEASTPAWWQPQLAPAAKAAAPVQVLTPTEDEPALTPPSAPDAPPVMAAEPAPIPAHQLEPTDEPAPRWPVPRGEVVLPAPTREPRRREHPANDAHTSPPFASTEDELSALLAPALAREPPAPIPTIAPRLAPTPDIPASATSLPSCEAAAASANQNVDFAQRDATPDLSRTQIAAVLDNGVWIARCDIPMSTSVELCIAIQRGAVIGVSVSSHPASAAINACLMRRAAGLHFPFSSRVDLAKTRF